ncbi:MAG TPA: hypothetical protein VNV66_12070 [Pilimelia sp.]|nr:hypothetical protein [Pilimelia sp.]
MFVHVNPLTYRRGAHPHRRHPVLAALLALCLAAVAALAAPAPAAAEPTTDPEGGTATVRKQLEAATRGFLDARTALAASRKRQAELTAQLADIERQLAEHTAVVARLAGTAYRTGRLGAMGALLNGAGNGSLVDRVVALDHVAANERAQLERLRQTREQAARARTAIAVEISKQQRQVAVMAARKAQAERAVAAAERRAAERRAAERRAAAERAAGGPTGARSGPGSGVARPAPRNPDGSWPAESCRVNDPTTTGCLTPRTLHALNQAKAAGFTRYVACFRGGSWGEHPQGRACDFAAQSRGFGGAAFGGDRVYGDNLAAYFVRNADRLGVLYVIWYRQIWLPSSGWQPYGLAGGDPSSDHTNHVHLSVY